jgi:hypothetical protein
MFLRFDDRGPLGFIDDRVFSETSEPQAVRQVLIQRKGHDLWCDIQGLDVKGSLTAAQARKVQDSGEGTCFLVYGGAWGLQLTDPATRETWHEPFLLLPPDGSTLR